ncbi:MAG: hypothetical protein GW762_02120 [Candidatus Pacebacteria bacterium]|nr:hypothetical protein [Candidatus Paceibacterota bacterium]PIR63553.1 MAG: hypothetical protein COU64_03790 [Candidatus Pacebacteria bacterium CG10_big_fil_rev_8_21_14_0_10_40_26]PIZ79208.1 MAG: hypothetical protein COY01_02165 [Candidatus Pacebacteria bacterium CG_4_10_14_0_2_um_filter_40_20]PJA68863.1 MAG: hypothetical protein CO156_02770 [Candidatus Pacebacteria bacterium CG_4_9_14_3_um_filter_40_12]PJC42175.1 MAG: hypothetical protein CO041_00875 [Candidatus Pacebacteria bacterium CG_4_9_
MKKSKKLEPILWAIIFFGLGYIFQATVSYVVVTVHPISHEHAQELFNQEIEHTWLGADVVTHVIPTSKLTCKPELFRTVEKQCEENIVVVFFDGAVLYGTCTTWSYRDFICEIHQPPVRRTDGILAQLPEEES